MTSHRDANSYMFVSRTFILFGLCKPCQALSMMTCGQDFNRTGYMAIFVIGMNFLRGMHLILSLCFDYLSEDMTKE
jgi:hypothetical protein